MLFESGSKHHHDTRNLCTDAPASNQPELIVHTMVGVVRKSTVLISRTDRGIFSPIALPRFHPGLRCQQTAITTAAIRLLNRRRLYQCPAIDDFIVY